MSHHTRETIHNHMNRKYSNLNITPRIVTKKICMLLDLANRNRNGIQKKKLKPHKVKMLIVCTLTEKHFLFDGLSIFWAISYMIFILLKFMNLKQNHQIVEFILYRFNRWYWLSHITVGICHLHQHDMYTKNRWKLPQRTMLKSICICL